MEALLALFVRSLRGDVRSKSQLWTRVTLAVGIIFVFWTSNLRFGGAPGLVFFQRVVGMNVLFICVAGMSYFASAITEEKEDGTLSLLRMTNLSPFAILLGKSTSRLCGGLLLLMVQLPFALLAVTLGGLHTLQVLKSYALLGALLFFACNAGLLCSVLAGRTGVAGFLTGLLGWVCAGALSSSPYNLPDVLANVLSTGGENTPIAAVCGAAGVLGLLAFLAGRLLFEGFCGEKAAPAAPSKKGLRGRMASLFRPRAGRAWKNAIAWRDFHYVHGGVKMLVVKTIFYLWLATTFYVESFAGRRWVTWSEFLAAICSFSLVAMAIEMVVSASRIYRIERRDRTLGALMLLPQERAELLKSKKQGVLYSLIPLLAGFALTVPFFLNWAFDFGRGEGVFWGAQTVAYLIVQIYLHCYVVGWFSLRMRWGALPVTLALTFIGNMLLASFAFLVFRQAGLIMLIIILTAVIFPLRRAFLRRLELAGEEE